VWNEYILRGLLAFRGALAPAARAELDACQFLVRGGSRHAHACPADGRR
jgi:hypothetical protein